MAARPPPAIDRATSSDPMPLATVGGPTPEAAPAVTGRIGPAAFRLSAALLAVVVVTAGLSLAVPSLFHDTAMMVGNLRGTCLVLLVVAAPALAWSMRATARGSMRAPVVWAGAVAYIAYNGVLLCFSAIFNQLFLLDVAVLGLAAWTLVVLLPAVRLRSSMSPRTARWIGGYLAVVAVLFGLLWLRDIVPALLDGGTPGSLAGLRMITNPVEILDFTFSIPAALLAATLLWRGRPGGLPLAGLLLVMFAIETTSIAVDQVLGHLADPTASLAAVPIMGALTLVGLWPLTVFLRRAMS